MSRGRVVIIALIGLGVIFALGIGAGVMRRAPQGAALESQQQAYRDGWVGHMGAFTQRFSPPLDRSRLQVVSPGSQCRLLDDVLELLPGAGCEVEIRAQSVACHDDHQVARLAVLRTDPVARRTAAVGRVRVSYRPHFEGATEASQVFSAEEMPLIVMPGGGHLVLRCVSGCEQRPLRLALNGRPSCR